MTQFDHRPMALRRIQKRWPLPSIHKRCNSSTLKTIQANLIEWIKRKTYKSSLGHPSNSLSTSV